MISFAGALLLLLLGLELTDTIDIGIGWVIGIPLLVSVFFSFGDSK